ncbi:EAL domain-containing protein [Oscillochloris sp. ZM17-4]|uniref:putative bifunctional diguanylate cyclase/phosphodiesterase n=1 Tax=Oscillochloris sp. ZM17-4 TaxID=2866714 RepID=UPI001C737090|nr:EAL domain-containing protein [Oscillochloris sp. ZM17-4]MBX0326572.1 EAL domain-containing protein [Oscillochloris sp. ZM17-4]
MPLRIPPEGTGPPASPPTHDGRFASLSLDLLCIIDEDDAIIQTNRVWLDALGYPTEELGSSLFIDLCWTEDRLAVADALAQLDAGTPSVRFDCRLIGRDGEQHWYAWQITRDPQNGLGYGIGRDISVQKHTEQMLAYQTHYDVVTGLPNRYLFHNRLDQEVIAARAAADSFALCVIDLDRFNQINDALGHAIGDEVLAFVALRLRSLVGSHALLARMGGDEFTLILRQIQSPEEAIARAGRILAVLEQPFPVRGQELFISASIGVSLFPRDGQDAMTLLKHADSAMYRVKATGRSEVGIFEPSIGAAARWRLDIEQQMRRALSLDQFELHFQPLLDLPSRKVVAVESLIRWRHPDQGVIMPGDFISVAEETNLIEHLFSWGLVEACRRAVVWQRAGRRPLRMAVNISARQFERADLVERVAEALLVSGLDPRWLELEITESMLMRDPEGSAVRIRRLHVLGVRVAIDDFGTGYSSLAYLQRFPVERLKIDRSFIWALGSEPDPESSAAALLRAITAMAHSLRLKIVAEGVESAGQHQFLAGLRCDEVQGFFYARPTSADALWDVIAKIEGS